MEENTPRTYTQVLVTVGKLLPRPAILKMTFLVVQKKITEWLVSLYRRASRQDGGENMTVANGNEKEGETKTHTRKYIMPSFTSCPMYRLGCHCFVALYMLIDSFNV